MDKDLIVWGVYWACVVINILLLWKFEKEEVYKDGITLLDTIIMLITILVPVINLMVSVLFLFTFVALYANEIIIIEPKQNKEDANE